MRIERFDGVWGGWYAVVGGRESKTYVFRWLAVLAGRRMTRKADA